MSDPDSAFPQPGCEGAPESVLFKLPLSGGERALLRNGEQPLKDLIFRGPDGQVALVDICEGFFQGLQVGTESPDGSITDLKDVKLGLDPNRGLPAAFSFSWSNDGKSLLAAIDDPDAPDGGPSRVVGINPQSGAVAELFSGGMGSGIFQIAQLENGLYVVSSNRVVTFHDGGGKITSTFKGNGFTLSPDRSSVVIFGEQLTTATEDDQQARLLVGQKANYEISSADISPDGTAVVFNRYDLSSGANEVALVTLGDSKFSAIASAPGIGEALFTGNGKAIAFTKSDINDGTATVQLAALGG